MSENLLRNSAACRQCGDAIESKHRHDFVTCKCGAISIDGGLDYVKVCVEEDFADYICTCVIEGVNNES